MGKKFKNKKHAKEMQERWVSIRKRDIYREMKIAVDEALNEYWAAIGQTVLWTQHYYACEQVTLKAYKLLKYVRKEFGGINECIDDKRIGDTSDAAIAFYCLHEDGRTSYQDESDVLEILSRSAFREMKGLKKIKELDEGVKDW